jgi:chromosome segregation and condensation protein ScpB
MFARIPALLLGGTTKAEIAAMYGVALGTLVGALQSARHIVAQGRAAA